VRLNLKQLKDKNIYLKKKSVAISSRAVFRRYMGIREGPMRNR